MCVVFKVHVHNVFCQLQCRLEVSCDKSLVDEYENMTGFRPDTSFKKHLKTDLLHCSLTFL